MNDITPMTPRALRINVPREFGRGILEDVAVWKALHQSDVRLSGGVITRYYVTLYLVATDIPHELIGLCAHAARAARGTASLCGAWLLNLEPSGALDAEQIERAL